MSEKRCSLGGEGCCFLRYYKQVQCPELELPGPSTSRGQTLDASQKTLPPQEASLLHTSSFLVLNRFFHSRMHPFPYCPSLKDRKPMLFIPAAPELSVAFQQNELMTAPLPFIHPPMQSGHSWRATEEGQVEKEGKGDRRDCHRKRKII